MKTNFCDYCREPHAPKQFENGECRVLLFKRRAEERFWDRCRAEADPEEPLTEEEADRVDRAIKQTKIDRAFGQLPTMYDPILKKYYK